MNIPMKKLTLTGLSDERPIILECLKRTQSFELGGTVSCEADGARVAPDLMRREKQLTEIAKIKFGIDFIQRGKSELDSVVKGTNKAAKGGFAESVDYRAEKAKKSLFTVRDAIDYDNFRLIAARESEVNETVDKVTAFNSELYSIRADEAKLKAQIANMAIYDGLDVPFARIHDTAAAFIILGTFNKKQFEKIPEGAFPDFSVRTLNVSDHLVSVLCFGASGGKTDAFAALKEYGFNQCAYTYDDTAAALIAAFRVKLSENYSRRAFIYNEIDKMGDELTLLKIYYDYLNLELESTEALSIMLQTGKTFTLSGWYPGYAEETILSALRSVTENLIVETAVPQEGDIPPTLVENRKLVQPYTSITNMFSVPSYKERDPNKYVGFFFFLFFGVMMGDVGYGIVLLLVTFFLLKFVKMESGVRKFLMIVCMGGVSAILWGFIFGGFFGIEKTVTEGGRETAVSILPGLISPVNDAMLLLGLCLGLGVIHISFGLVLKAADLIRKKQYFDALCESGFMLLLFIGAAMLIAGMLGINIPALNITGIVFIVAALAGLIIFGGRHKKGAMRIFGGFGQIYGLINYISDILSYSRLFALSIAGGIIANVANQMAVMIYTMLSGSIGFAAWVPGLIVALFLHAFNVALGILSIYVHNSRLQFVEFFGKFYEGGGHEFIPFGSGTKYVRIT